MSVSYSRRMTDSPAAQLYELVSTIAPEKDPATVIRLGDEHWPEIRERGANAHDAETCRLVGLACALTGRLDVVEVWRSRAEIRFAEVGWLDGTATVISSRALAELARANDDYVRGRTLDAIEGSVAAYEIVETIGSLAQGGRSAPDEFRIGDKAPGPDLTARFYWEKSGFFLLLLGRFAEARARYARAAEIARPGRGAAKVRGGALLVEYLAAKAGETIEIDPEEIVAEQREVVAQTMDVGDPDIHETAVHNLEVFERGGDDPKPYEVL